MLSGIYLVLSLFTAVSVFFAVVQGRRLYFFVPVYFLLAWLAGELAFIHLAWQIALTVVVAFFGGLVSTEGQLGLLLFAISWLGLLHLHRQSMDSATTLRAALREGLGENYRGDIPAERAGVLRDDINASEWARPFSMRRDGVIVHRSLPYGDAQ